MSSSSFLIASLGFYMYSNVICKHWQFCFFFFSNLNSFSFFLWLPWLGLPMEKAMALQSSTFAWKIQWTEKPGRLHTMGSLRVRHDWATSLSLFTFMHWRRNWQPPPVFFLPGESQGRWRLMGCGVAQSQTWLKRLSSSSSRTSKYMMNNCRESRHPGLVPNLRGNAFRFSQLRMMFTEGL